MQERRSRVSVCTATYHNETPKNKNKNKNGEKKSGTAQEKAPKYK